MADAVFVIFALMQVAAMTVVFGCFWVFTHYKSRQQGPTWRNVIVEVIKNYPGFVESVGRLIDESSNKSLDVVIESAMRDVTNEVTDLRKVVKESLAKHNDFVNITDMSDAITEAVNGIRQSLCTGSNADKDFQPAGPVNVVLPDRAPAKSPNNVSSSL